MSPKMPTSAVREFPAYGLMPKEETEAAAFVRKYPDYDGRRTVIAVLDTGVDPGAAGLSVTTDGKPKIIDIVDCTGAGDVKLSQPVKATKADIDGKSVLALQGISGRQLLVSSDWTNPTGEYRLGLKRGYELFPGELKHRLSQERQEKFDIEHSRVLAQVQRELAAWESTHPAIKMTASDRLKKADLESRIEVLKSARKSFEDPGPIYDCVCFHDGSHWRAVIDVEESGDLRSQPCLTDYKIEHQYHTFGKSDMLNFSINIYDEGSILSIVTVAGSHGTHVAGIAAANFPEDPVLNGVAPGAQIVSLKIGDTRLGSMETADGLTRAAIALAENKCDLANMSYGESSGNPTKGYFTDLLSSEAIGKHGCIFVTSAGNDGPCISSIGAPAGMFTGLITVGAYVKHSQMQAEYALWETVPERPYTWSSRGPTSDGFAGVDVFAPGSAITSLPQYGLVKLGLKNGTSMASPNACGCIALLVSGLKALNMSHNPYRVKRSVVNAAKSVDDPMDVGFIQVDKAWEYLQKYSDEKELDVLYETSVTEKAGGRGIYLREAEECNTIQHFTVNVSPTFMREQTLGSGENNAEMFAFESRLVLIARDPWVRAPEYLSMHSEGRLFGVRVDPTQLSPGNFYYSEIAAFDVNNPDRGPLFVVPVSVTKPIVPTKAFVKFPSIKFDPGDIDRRFIAVPAGATYADLLVRSVAHKDSTPARFFLHLLQIIPQKSQKQQQTYVITIGNTSEDSEQTERKSFSVKGGTTLEVALAQFWSSFGQHVVDVEIVFHGIQIAGTPSNVDNVVYLDGNSGISRLDITAPVQTENNINAAASLNTLRRNLRPSESNITPLSPQRDRLPSGKQIYGLVLTYKFSMSEAGQSVTAHIPSLQDQLYDHYASGVFGMVYDVNEKIIAYLDVYAKTVKLDHKGDYTIRFRITSDNEEMLVKHQNTVCQLDITGGKAINLEAYKSIADAYTKEKGNFGKSTLKKGDRKPVFLAAPSDASTYPKDAKLGDMLVGTLTFANGKKVDGGQYSAVHIIPDMPPKAKETDGGETEQPSETLSKLTDAVRDLQISYLKKLPAESEERKKLMSQLEGEMKDYLPFALARLDLLTFGVDAMSSLEEKKADEILSAAGAVLAMVDTKHLAEFYGVKDVSSNTASPLTPEETKQRKKIRQENDKKKQALIVALKAKYIAHAAKSNGQKEKTLTEAYDALQEWTDVRAGSKESESILIYIRNEHLSGRHGNALKAADRWLDDACYTKENAKNIQRLWKIKSDLLAEVAWQHLIDYERRWTLIRSPPGGIAPF